MFDLIYIDVKVLGWVEMKYVLQPSNKSCARIPSWFLRFYTPNVSEKSGLKMNDEDNITIMVGISKVNLTAVSYQNQTDILYLLAKQQNGPRQQKLLYSFLSLLSIQESRRAETPLMGSNE